MYSTLGAALASAPSEDGMQGVMEAGEESSDGESTVEAGVVSAVLGSMISNNLTRDEVTTLPFGVGVPLLEAGRACRAHPPEGLEPAGYALLQRDDLAAQVGPALAMTLCTSGCLADPSFLSLACDPSASRSRP